MICNIFEFVDFFHQYIERNYFCCISTMPWDFHILLVAPMDHLIFCIRYNRHYCCKTYQNPFAIWNMINILHHFDLNISNIWLVLPLNWNHSHQYMILVEPLFYNLDLDPGPQVWLAVSVFAKIFLWYTQCKCYFQMTSRICKNLLDEQSNHCLFTWIILDHGLNLC